MNQGVQQHDCVSTPALNIIDVRSSETLDGGEIKRLVAKVRCIIAMVYTDESSYCDFAAVPDPFLAAEVAYAFVKNMQKEGDEKHLKAVATPKHFLGQPFTIQTVHLTILGSE